MTGLDCLKEEMEKRGCQKTQIESKTTAIVLEILSNDVGHYATSQAEHEKKIGLLESRSYNLTQEIFQKQLELKDLQAQVERWRTDAQSLKDREAKRQEETIKAFYNELKNCETPEGRDAVRKATLFDSMVDIDTKYDNTAYIYAMGSILSGGKFDPVQEGGKINPKLFNKEGK